jgi:hypothetical protein
VTPRAAHARPHSCERSDAPIETPFETVDAGLELVELRLDPDHLVAELEKRFVEIARCACFARHDARVAPR